MSRRPLALLLSLALALGAAWPARGQPVGKLGVMGDSLSNEYAEGTAPYARSWPELLALYRGINLGPTAAEAGVGGWGDIRGVGHQEVYARPGATTDAMVLEGQAELARFGIVQRGVTHVVICPSGNDFSSWGGVFAFYYYNLWTPGRSRAFVDAGIDNVRTLVTTAQNAGAKVVLATMPDFGGVMPLMQDAFTDAAARQRATIAINEFNRKLRDLARERACGLVDLQALDLAIFGNNGSPRQILAVGGVPINLRLRSGPNDPPNVGFVADGVHFHTVIQGLWANAIIAGLNQKFGTGIPELTETELLAAAGIPYAGRDTLRAVIGPFSSYVGDGPCRADFDHSGTVDLLDIFGFLQAWFGGNLAADFNADGSLDVQDIFAFLLVALGAGCS
jgi:lysophospholipase L1-like esterase